MKIKKRVNYMMLFCLFFPLFLSGQEIIEEEPEQKTFGIGVVPQYAISHGLRFDLDFRLNDKNHWLVVAPLVFLSNEPNLDWDYNSMAGAGLEIQHKLFMNRRLKRGNPYISYGPVFNYFSVKDNGLIAREFTENDGNYIAFNDAEITTNIFKIGGNIIFGIHYFVLDNLYLDTYVGTGIRFSFDDQTTGLHGFYNDWWGDMGYSGTLMVGGFRFGVMF